MNRMVRRAEEKKEKKAEREKAKRKAEVLERRRKRREAAAKRREERAAARKAGTTPAAEPKQAGEGPRRSNPGRFAGVLLFATVFFISLQAVAPSDPSIAGQLVSASFYLLFGYFAALWMKRRDATSDPVPLAVIAAVLMTAVTFASQWFQAGLEPLPLMLAAAIPLAYAGAWLGRLVWNRAP